MGILGEQFRFWRDLTKDAFYECGFEDLKDELKDLKEAIKGN